MIRENLLFPPTFKISPPVFEKFNSFLHTLRVIFSPPTLTMMHLSITQCTYWTPLVIIILIIIIIVVVIVVIVIIIMIKIIVIIIIIIITAINIADQN